MVTTTGPRLLEDGARRLRARLAEQGVAPAAVAEYLSVLGEPTALEAALARYRAAVRFELLPGVGHFVTDQDPEAVTRGLPPRPASVISSFSVGPQRKGLEPGGIHRMKDLKIWMNGRLVPQAEAVLPVNSAAVFYATNVFEGLRAYWNEADGELYCFRLAEHFARLRESMKMMRFTVSYSDMDLHEAVRDVLRGNEIHEDVHMHLVAYVAAPGLDSTTPTGLYINPRRRARITDGSGLRCCITSWQRTSDNAIPIRLKCGANYQNGRLATLQAKADGYDAPIFLNQQGTVAEGSGATFFMVRRGQLVTPPITSDILESITRATLIDAVAS